MTGLGAQEDKPAYVSLLSAYPFVPSTALQPTYSTLVPRIVGTSTSKSAFTLTTASLRQLSTTVESFQKLMQAVQRAQRETEARATLQRQEHARQKAEYTKVLGLLQTLRAKRQDDAQRKLDALRAKHAEMLKRTEAVLKRLMLRASPELNEHETRWFHELSRMKEEVYGFDKYDDQSLNAKADRVSLCSSCSLDNCSFAPPQLRIEVDRLMPQLSEVKAHEPARWELVTKADLLGTSQAFQLGIRSQSE
jgi:nucleoporin NUP82